MTNIRNNLLKLSVITSALLTGTYSGYAQGAMDNAADPGNAVVYNQSGMGTTILFVFAGLIVILLAFKYMGKYMTRDSKKPVELPVQPESQVVAQTDRSGEINAAIAMALYLYSNELHDQENPVITMIKVSRTYSPWSSKIYGLRKSPR